jgi:hypothetical protein
MNKALNAIAAAIITDASEIYVKAGPLRLFLLAFIAACAHAPMSNAITSVEIESIRHVNTPISIFGIKTPMGFDASVIMKLTRHPSTAHNHTRCLKPEWSTEARFL